jgi:ribose 5-phosphate isomerase B
MIAIGNDHAGYRMKVHVVRKLMDWGFDVQDLGSYSDESTDYPSYAHAVAEWVESGKAEWGILLCGSANGMAMTANKHSNIRCAICWSDEIAHLAKAHNNANILAIPARFVTEQECDDIMRAFVETKYEGGRHDKRLAMIPCG